jgi:hypothetical protein
MALADIGFEVESGEKITTRIEGKELAYGFYESIHINSQNGPICIWKDGARPKFI